MGRSAETQDQIASETDKNGGQYRGGSTPLERRDIALPAQLPHEITVSKGKFPRMVSLDSPPVEAENRNDFGAVITQGQWEKLQQLKQRAATGGYVIDEYSQ